MSAIVIDASVSLAWCFEDEASPEGDELLEIVRDEGAIVPVHWHLEMSNALIGAERRGRIKPAEIADRLKLLAGLPITIDNETVYRAWREVLALARSERLTAYDAAYLELAIREGIGLATRDQHLVRAAERAGVRLLI